MQFNKVLNSQKLPLLTMYMQSVKESSMLLLTPKRGPSTMSFHLFLWLILPLGEILLSLQTLTLPKKMKMLLQKQGYLIFSMIFNVLLCKIYLTHHKKAERNMTEKKRFLCLMLSVSIFHPFYISSSPSSESLLLALCSVMLQPVRCKSLLNRMCNKGVINLH